MSVETKKYLSRVYMANELIESNVRELEVLRGLSSNISVNLHSCGDSGRIENVVFKVAMLESEIDDEICNLIDIKEEVKNAINTVSDINQNMVLRLVYLEFRSIEEVAEIMNYSVRHVHRLHKKALGNVRVDGKDKG